MDSLLNELNSAQKAAVTSSSDIVQRIVKTRKFSIDERVARSRISRRKAQGLGFREPKSSHANSADRQEFEEIFDAYESELKISNRLDYDDLLLRCQQLLEEAPVCVSNVEAVLIDEFQDTNTVQYELMKLFAARHRRITIVGDPDQSIYGFRSAESKNLALMKAHYPETIAIILEENYRSCGAILRAAQNVIEQDTARPSKCLQATHSYGTSPVLRKLPSATAEAAWIVFEIQRAIAMTGKMLTPSDFAILLRSAHLSRQIESAMGKAGMPYQMVGGCRFYDRLEIKILLDYLKVIYQPSNNEALLAIMNVPPRKIGEKSKEVLFAEAKENDYSLFDFVRQISRGVRGSKARLTKSAEQNLGSLVSLIVSGKEILKTLSAAADAPRALLAFVIKKLSFKEYLESTHIEDHDSRWANVEELLSQAEDISQCTDEKVDLDALPHIEGVEQQEEESAESSLSQFLANISLSSQADALEENAIQHKVTISTIHAAKGLEWPVVFVPALYNGSIPHSRAEDTDEERRLLYVAMTRAQALLYLSQPLHQSGAQSSEETVLSSFVTPKLASKFFTTLGPSFCDRLVKAVGITLKRPIPSAAWIVQASESLQSTEDDLWPESGERGQLDGALWNDMSIGSSKRRREDEDNPQVMRSLLSIDGHVSTYAGNLTMGKTTVSVGFTTAADQLRTQPTPTLAPTITSANDVSRKRAKSPDKPAKKPKTAPPNQPTIASLFGPKSQTNAGRKLEGAENSVSSKTSTPQYQPSLPTPTLTTTSSYQQPQDRKPHLLAGLSTHRLTSSKPTATRPKPLLETNANPRAYAFLSSSPTTESAPAAKAVDADENKTDSVAVKPASTFHAVSSTTMSMTQLQGRQGGSGVGVKRRYGMGGRMVGWDARKNK
ncbi:MAG: hypothetical protein Q9160_005242 [Pyrenula sp. 1 TL-2023]